MDYITLKEASQKWNVTPRQINEAMVTGTLAFKMSLLV